MKKIRLHSTGKILLIGAAIFLVAFSAIGQFRLSSAQNSITNWNYPGYDLQNSNYDPQTVINSGNVNQLQLGWIYQVPENPFNIQGTAKSLGIETTPLVISGIVYFATPYNDVIALNANSGTTLWTFQVNMSKFVSESWWAPAYNERSLTYNNGTIYFMASDTSVYGLNALTGQVVFTLPPIGENISGNNGQYYGELAPLIYKNIMIVRASTTDYGGRGFVAAYDMTTKQQLWIWYAIPPEGGNSTWDVQSSGLGNINPYPGDWGNNSLIGGGAAWGLMALDQSTGVLYFSTGHPSDVYAASLRPGPNLYSDSLIALNLTSGKLVWYYQINSHDITEHEGGWSVTLANVTIDGRATQVVIQAAKNNFVYVLDAGTGKLVYNPIGIGAPSTNSPNDNLQNNASMTLSQNVLTSGEICPGPDGGVEMSPALDNNTLFVASQNACGLMFPGTQTYKGQTINGFVLNGDPSAAENATIYAINLSTGSIVWHFNIPNRYQGSAIVVSAGVVYAVDRAGILYALNEQTGSLLRSISLGGVGASGVAIAEDLSGKMMLFAAAGGADIPTPTPGVLLAFGVPSAGSVTSGSSPANGNNGNILEVSTAVLAIAVVGLSLFVLFRRSASGRKPTVQATS